MAEPIKNSVKKSINATENAYYRLVLLVGESGTGKTQILRDISIDNKTEVININMALSAELLELTAKQRILRLPKILDNITNNSYSILVLDNLEIIFDKDLKQDPLRLLQGISRNRSVIASWNGVVAEGKLIYAETGHLEYRSYDMHDLTIVSMDGMATINSSLI